MFNQAPPDRLTASQLQRAYWFVTNREKIRKIIRNILIIICLWIWGLFIGLTINYFLTQKYYDELMVNFSRNYVNYEEYRAKDRPKKIQVSGISVIDAGEDRYDVFAQVRNINPKWVAYIEYQFLISNLKTKVYSDFILPDSAKTLVDLGLESKQRVTSAKISFIKVSWHKILGFDKLRDEVLKFTITDPLFVPSAQLKAGEKISISKTVFKAANNSSYNFWKVKFIILLYSGARVAGVSIIEDEDFMSGQTKELETTWFNKLPNISDLEIFVDVNILDENNFKTLKIKPNFDIRDYF